MLQPIPNIPVAFCKYVHLNYKLFEPDFPIHVQLTVSWQRNQTFKEGSAAWSENVTTSGFTACVLVAGRHFFGGVPTPSVFWMAYQKGLMVSSKGQLMGGSIDIPSWYSGSRCQRLNGIYDFWVRMASIQTTTRPFFSNFMLPPQLPQLLALGYFLALSPPLTLSL